MRRLRELLALFGAAVFLTLSCGDEPKEESGEECDEGTEGCSCYGNGTCNGGLECRRNRCVTPGGGRGGSAGSGGQPGCPSDREDCSGTCADLANDEANCGSCGNVCGSGEECSEGRCTCIGGRVACGENCVDTTSDPDHCGACDEVCAAEQVCSASACSDDCADSLTLCGRSCVDTTTSIDHCGACDAACVAGQTCEGGECTCPDGLTACGNSCVNTDEDSAHCGGCGDACGAREECVAAQCDCSDGNERCGTACVTAGTCGTGGGGGMGGSPTGGAAGRGGNAGSGMGGSGGTGGAPPSGPPIVELLVDNSSSMYETREAHWDPLYSALMDASDGAVQTYQDRARIGFSSFRGPKPSAVPETDPACAQIETVGSVNPATVAPALDNRAAIDSVYRALGEQGRHAMAGVDAGLVGWETPTGHALKRVADTLAAFNPNPAGRKYIFLLTDGMPNTCMVGDPQCGQDFAVKAAQDARVLGVTTLVLGVGNTIHLTTGCTPTYHPCGEPHFQDMANAGTGQPVQAPLEPFWYEICNRQANGSPGLPKAAYVPVGMGGTAEYYVGADRDTLRSELAAMFERVIAGSVP